MDHQARELIERLGSGEGEETLVCCADGSLWLLRDGDVTAHWAPVPAGPGAVADRFVEAVGRQPDGVKAWAISGLATTLGAPMVADPGEPSGEGPASSRPRHASLDWDDQPDDPQHPQATPQPLQDPGLRTLDERFAALADVADDIAEGRARVTAEGSSPPPDIGHLAAWLLLQMEDSLSLSYEFHSFPDPLTLQELRQAHARGDPDVDLFDGVWIGRNEILVLRDGFAELRRTLPDASYEPDTSTEALAPLLAVRMQDYSQMLAVTVALCGRQPSVGDRVDDALILSVWSDAEWRFESTSRLFQVPPLGPGPSSERPPMHRLVLPARPVARRGSTSDPTEPEIERDLDVMSFMRFGGTPHGLLMAGGSGGTASPPASPQQRALQDLRRRLLEMTPVAEAVERVMITAASAAPHDMRVADLQRIRDERLAFCSPTMMSQLVDTAIETLESLARRKRR